MMYTLLHINDIALTAENNDKHLSSAGYAVIKGDEIAFGNTALQLHRLYPLHTYNHYWTQFNQNPIQSSSKHIRHNADLAFMHLCDIKDHFQEVENWLIAVPSNFGPNELSLLLGLLNAAKYKHVKFIDAAVLASSLLSMNGEYTYVDIQLHQTVLTRLKTDNETQVLDHKILKDVNLLTIEKAIEKSISNELMNQARFDSRHNAETEQLLYNKLFYILKGLEEHRNYKLEIEYHGHTHQALVNRETIHTLLTPFYTAIQDNIETSSVVFNFFLSSLPGCKEFFDKAFLTQKESLLNAAKYFEEHIQNTQDSFNYINTLPKPTHSIQADNISVPNKTNITHMLIEHHAIMLNGNDLYFNKNHTSTASPQNDSVYSIYLSDNQYWIKNENNNNLYLNNAKIDTDTILHLGDKITLEGSSTSNQFICVD